MAETTASSAWYLLVFAALGFAATTFAAIMSHMSRVPQQRGLLAVMAGSALAAFVTLLVTQIPERSRVLFTLLTAALALAIGAALLDLAYFVQARRRRLPGANWSLVVALALLGCAALGLLAQFGSAR